MSLDHWEQTPTTEYHHLSSATDDDCKTFALVLYVIVFGIVLVFGLAGNTLSFLVLQWEKRNYVATFLLQALCMTDNLFLFTTGVCQIYSATEFYFDIKSDTCVGPFIQVYVWPLVHITQMATVWMTVLVAANRYVAICKPFQAPILCTLRRVKLQVLLMAAGIVIYNVPRFLEYSTTYTGAASQSHDNGTVICVANQTYLKSHVLYNILYENVLYCLFVFLGPFTILVVLNLCLVRELMSVQKRHKQRHLFSPTSSDEENNLTLVMIIIMLVFLVCQTPAFFNQLLFITLPKGSDSCGRPYFYYFHLSNLIVSINSAINIFIYFLFRAQFRQRLRAFLRRDRKALKRMNSSYEDSTHGNTQSLYINDRRNTETREEYLTVINQQ